MLFSYIKIALRSQLKNFSFSFINIFGLGLGLASVMLIGLYINYELKYDTHFSKANRIYRIPTTLGSYETPGSPLPLIQALDRFPEVESATRLFRSDVMPYLSANDIDNFQEKDAFYADSTVFNVFDFQFIKGDASFALRDVNSVVISESMAHKYFGEADPINKNLRRDNKEYFKVTGVFKDLPASTHFDAHFLFSSLANPLMNDYSAKNWDWLYSSLTYIVLKENVSPDHLNASLKTLFWDVTKNDRETYGADYMMYLQPLKDIHLHSHLDGELKANGSVGTLITLGSIAFVILIIACINFMNLATAGSMKRAKEVGVRKVMGVHRSSLTFQFLTESILICLFAGIIAFSLMSVFLNEFNDFTGTQMKVIDLFAPSVLGGMILLMIGIGLLAGIYPAFFLSSYDPVKVLKGNFSNNFSAIRIRKALVIGQFAIGCAVLSVTLIIRHQLSFMLGKDLGFKKEGVMIVHLPNDTVRVENVKNELETVTGVKEASQISDPFSNISGWLIWTYEGAPEGTTLATTRFFADEDFLKTLEIPLAAGRYYSLEHKADSNAVVINETAARKMGWTAEQAIGKRMGGPERPFQVIGVLKDFHFRHLSSPITPFVMVKRRNFSFEKTAIALRIDGNTKEVMERIEKKWSSLVPQWPIRYNFLNQDLDQQYQFETKLSKLTSVFSGLAIVIASLGLLGLALFAVRQKEKEIGIRKVLGADTAHLVGLTTKEFTKLVLIGVLIALPIAYLASEQWLQMYAYRDSLSLVPFVIALVSSVAIAVLTVSFISWRASSADPVKTLRSE